VINRAVIALLAGCAAFAGLIAAEIIAADRADGGATINRARVEAAVPPQKQSPARGELIATALSQPLFSPSRRPTDNIAAPVSDLSGLRLTGIVIKPDRRIAIFTSADGKTIERAEGETFDAWLLERISPLEVSLSGPTGMQTLVPKADPNLAQSKPRPQSAAGGIARTTAAVQSQRSPKPPAHAGSSQPPTNPTRAQ